MTKKKDTVMCVCDEGTHAVAMPVDSEAYVTSWLLVLFSKQPSSGEVMSLIQA